MAIVKCQNPQCDYFQKTVPEGDFCPFCGEPLGNVKLSDSLPLPSVQNPPPPVQPVYQQPAVQNPPVQPVYQQPAVQNPPVQPVYQQPAVQNPPVQPVYQPTPVQNPPIQPVYQQPAVQNPPVQPVYQQNPDATVVEAVPPKRNPLLKLIHTSGQEFPMYGQRAYIGRRGGEKKPQPDIDLTDLPYAERISRPHAHIVWDERSQGYIIVDDRSANGTILDGNILKPLQPYALINGSQLEFGQEHRIQFTVQIS